MARSNVSVLILSSIASNSSPNEELVECVNGAVNYLIRRINLAPSILDMSYCVHDIGHSAIAPLCGEKLGCVNITYVMLNRWL